MVLMLSALDELRIAMEVTSSFSSIKATLLHIWDAETIWLGRLKGESLLLWPSDQFKGTTQEMFEGVLQTSTDFKDFVQEHKGLEGTCAFKDTKGNPYEMPVESIIQHCMNHSTFHRGQLITLLRQFGEKDLLSTDFITFLRHQQPS